MKIMHYPSLLFVASLFIACSGTKNPSGKSQDIRKINVIQSYPKKKVILQDIAEVRYIPVETNDDFLCSSGPRTITPNKIIIPVPKSGDILVFDREGKALSKINRKGGGAEEYNNVYQTAFDESTGELYAGGDPSKIRVYTLDGKYLRTLTVKEDTYIDNFWLFDKDNLLCYQGRDSIPAYTVSNRDGSITHEISIPFEKKINSFIERKDNNGHSVVTPHRYSVQETKDGFFITATSTDTVYRVSPGKVPVPVIVREPSVQTMEVPVFLEYGPETEQYMFLSTIKKEFNWENGSGFPRTFLFVDKGTNEIFEQEIANTDFEGQQNLSVNGFFSSCKTPPGTGAIWLSTDMLKEAYDNNKLSGELERVVAGMEEDDNGVVMLITLK